LRISIAVTCLKVFAFTFPVVLLGRSEQVFAQREPKDTIWISKQKDLIDIGTRIFKLDKVEEKRSMNDSTTVLFSILPLSPGSVGSKGIAVSAINASFHLGKETTLSTAYFYPYISNGSFGAILAPYLWFDKNRWNGVGDFRILENSIPDYGIGTSRPKTHQYRIDFNHVRTYFTFHKLLVNYLYVGAGYNLDYFYNVNQVKSDSSGVNFSSYPYGTGPNTTSSGVTINLLRDIRKNPVNPSGGFYSVAIFRLNRKSFGSTYNWSSLYIDIRRYLSFSTERHKILALRTIYWATYGQVPYLNFPATFQDINNRAGRGYTIYRYRGRQMLYAEAEYRFDITGNGFLGGVAFVNAQSMMEATTNKFQYVSPAIGTGLRVKFNRRSNSNVGLDFAWGKDGFIFYVNLGEFF
jgi:Omp85 superfamily domain